jgi:hypothetical protein
MSSTLAELELAVTHVFEISSPEILGAGKVSGEKVAEEQRRVLVLLQNYSHSIRGRRAVTLTDRLLAEAIDHYQRVYRELEQSTVPLADASSLMQEIGGDSMAALEDGALFESLVPQLENYRLALIALTASLRLASENRS